MTELEKYKIDALIKRIEYLESQMSFSAHEDSGRQDYRNKLQEQIKICYTQLENIK